MSKKFFANKTNMDLNCHEFVNSKLVAIGELVLIADAVFWGVPGLSIHATGYFNNAISHLPIKRLNNYNRTANYTGTGRLAADYSITLHYYETDVSTHNRIPSVIRRHPPIYAN